MKRRELLRNLTLAAVAAPVAVKAASADEPLSVWDADHPGNFCDDIGDVEVMPITRSGPATRVEKHCEIVTHGEIEKQRAYLVLDGQEFELESAEVHAQLADWPGWHEWEPMQARYEYSATLKAGNVFHWTDNGEGYMYRIGAGGKGEIVLTPPQIKEHGDTRITVGML